MVGFIKLTILTKLSNILYLMCNTDSDIITNNLIVKGETYLCTHLYTYFTNNKRR